MALRIPLHPSPPEHAIERSEGHSPDTVLWFWREVRLAYRWKTDMDFDSLPPELRVFAKMIFDQTYHLTWEKAFSAGERLAPRIEDPPPPPIDGPLIPMPAPAPRAPGAGPSEDDIPF